MTKEELEKEYGRNAALNGGRGSGQTVRRIIELYENKIADIKANCDLAIEGRDIKIKELELELTVEKDQHQEEINLHLHAEEYIKSLEQQIEKMKCCGNCAHLCECGIKGFEKCKNYDKWEIKENG